MQHESNEYENKNYNEHVETKRMKNWARSMKKGTESMKNWLENVKSNMKDKVKHWITENAKSII